MAAAATNAMLIYADRLHVAIVQRTSNHIQEFMQSPSPISVQASSLRQSLNSRCTASILLANHVYSLDFSFF